MSSFAFAEVHNTSVADECLQLPLEFGGLLSECVDGVVSAAWRGPFTCSLLLAEVSLLLPSRYTVHLAGTDTC